MGKLKSLSICLRAEKKEILVAQFSFSFRKPRASYRATRWKWDFVRYSNVSSVLSTIEMSQIVFHEASSKITQNSNRVKLNDTYKSSLWILQNFSREKLAQFTISASFKTGFADISHVVAYRLQSVLVLHSKPFVDYFSF